MHESHADDGPRAPCSRCGEIDPHYRAGPVEAAARELLAGRGIDWTSMPFEQSKMVYVAACDEVATRPDVKRAEEAWDELCDLEDARWDETVAAFGAVICSTCLTGPEITQLDLPFVATVLDGEERARAAGDAYPADLSELARSVLADADRDAEAGIRYGNPPRER